MNNINKKIISILLVISFLFSFLPNIDVNANTNGLFNFTITEGIENNGRKDITLNWEDYKFLSDANTKYAIARKDLQTNKWEYRGRYNEEVKVLNVYPDIENSGKLSNWMTSLSNKYENVKIVVDKVKQSDFNKEPEKYLNKSSGSYYNYDVVVFGFWDSHNKMDISSKGSKVIQEFIDTGGGVLFGHDTAQHLNRNENFINLVESNSNIVIGPRNTSTWVYSNLIGVNKQGTVTTYPFDINTEDLVIPMTHTVGQLVDTSKNDDIIFMNLEKNYYPQPGVGPYYHYNVNNGSKDSTTIKYQGISYETGAYLIIDGNIGFIQCGHTSGNTNLAEQKVLANSIYALVTSHFKTSATEQILDQKAPDKPEYTVDGNEITFTSRDDRSSYEYRIIAIPFGHNMPTLDDDLIYALENKNSHKNGELVFSNSVVVSVGGILDSFEYVIDKNPTVTKISNGIELDVINDTTSDVYNHFEYEEELDINNNDYMHIIAKDLSKNRSLVTTIKLWDKIPNVTVKINYVDIEGNEIDTSTYESKKYGTTFSPQINSINGYIYRESKPSEKIVVFYDNEEITQVFDKPVERDIYLVGQRNLNESDIDIEHFYKKMSAMLNTTVSLLVPEVGNYNFLGYYTLNDKDGERVNVIGSIIDILWGKDSIYIHYEREVSEGTVKFIRSTDKVELGSYSVKGYVGEPLNISGVDVSKNVNISDLEAYENRRVVGNDVQIFLTGDTDKDTVEVELIPKTKTVVHYGFSYIENDNDDLIFTKREDVTYSGVAKIGVDLLSNEEITDLIDSEGTKIIYTTSSAIEIDLLNDDSKNWYPLESSKNKEIDFTNDSPTVLVGYYRGVLPEQSYSFTVDYKNKISDDNIGEQYESGNVELNEKVSIPFNMNITKENYINNRDVEFEAKEIRIINDINEEKIFNVGEDYSNYFPRKGYNGEYRIDVLYDPIANILYKDKLVYDGDNGYETIIGSEAEYLIRIPYDNQEYSSNPRYSPDYFEVVEVIIDGQNIPPDEFDFSILSDSYDKTVEVSYKEKTYDVTVNGTLNGEETDKTISFNDIPIREVLLFKVPFIKGYAYHGFNSSYDDYITVENGILSFDPKKEGNFIINIDYKQISTITTSYYLIDGTKLLDDDIVEEAFIGDDYTVNVPIDSPQYHEIAYAYADRVVYEGIHAGDKYNVKVQNPVHNLVYIYQKIPMYYLNVISNSEEGEVNDENNYNLRFFHGDESYLMALANSGYEFKEWVIIEGHEAIIEDINEPFTTIIMPDGNVTVKATFEKVSTGNGGDIGIDAGSGGNTIGVSGGGSESEEKEDISNSVKEGDSRKITSDYRNKPYIVGYVDDTVGPLDNSTRIEFIRMIYNLIGDSFDNIYMGRLDLYEDVRSDAWYSEALALTINIGLVSGYDNKINPYDEISRSEIAVILVKLMEFLELEIKEPLDDIGFLDIEGHWAEEYIKILYSNGIAKGNLEGKFNPDEKATRAEIVAFINRALSRDITTYDKNVTFKDLPKTHWAYDDLMNAANGNNPNIKDIEHINN